MATPMTLLQAKLVGFNDKITALMKSRADSPYDEFIEFNGVSYKLDSFKACKQFYGFIDAGIIERFNTRALGDTYNEIIRFTDKIRKFVNTPTVYNFTWSLKPTDSVDEIFSFLETNMLPYSFIIKKGDDLELFTDQGKLYDQFIKRFSTTGTNSWKS